MRAHRLQLDVAIPVASLFVLASVRKLHVDGRTLGHAPKLLLCFHTLFLLVRASVAHLLAVTLVRSFLIFAELAVLLASGLWTDRQEVPVLFLLLLVGNLRQLRALLDVLVEELADALAVRTRRSHRLIHRFALAH